MKVFLVCDRSTRLESGRMDRLFALETRAAMRGNFIQSIYLPLMFVLFGIVAGKLCLRRVHFQFVCRLHSSSGILHLSADLMDFIPSFLLIFNRSLSVTYFALVCWSDYLSPCSIHACIGQLSHVTGFVRGRVECNL